MSAGESPVIGLGKFSKLGDNKDTGRGYHRRADHSSRYRVIPPDRDILTLAGGVATRQFWLRLDVKSIT